MLIIKMLLVQSQYNDGYYHPLFYMARNVLLRIRTKKTSVPYEK